MIRQRRKKMTRRDFLAWLDQNPNEGLSNLASYGPAGIFDPQLGTTGQKAWVWPYPKSYKAYTDMVLPPKRFSKRNRHNQVHSGQNIERLGKPLLTLPSMEAPGVWILKDTEAKLTWIIFSDGHLKRCFKGTSYEIMWDRRHPPTDTVLAGSIRRVMKHLGVGIYR